MFNGRMLNIIRHLKTQGESTYKEMAKELGVSERSVRYDVDRSTTFYRWSTCLKSKNILREC